MKKAQSISINTIVVAAVALIVLVVVIAIFSGRIKWFTTGARDCSTQGGQCKTEENCPSPYNTILHNTNCEDSSTVCCIQIINPGS